MSGRDGPRWCSLLVSHGKLSLCAGTEATAAGTRTSEEDRYRNQRGASRTTRYPGGTRDRWEGQTRVYVLTNTYSNTTLELRFAEKPHIKHCILLVFTYNFCCCCFYKIYHLNKCLVIAYL